MSVGVKIPSQPGRPVINRVDGRKVTIDWTPPVSNGRSQIIQYVIHYTTADVDLESFMKPKIAGRSTSCTFSKMMKYNKTYKFAVAAKNKSRLGPLSEFSDCVKTPTDEGKNVMCTIKYASNLL